MTEEEGQYPSWRQFIPGRLLLRHGLWDKASFPYPLPPLPPPTPPHPLPHNEAGKGIEFGVGRGW